jgi:hypothetical protein
MQTKTPITQKESMNTSSYRKTLASSHCREDKHVAADILLDRRHKLNSMARVPTAFRTFSHVSLFWNSQSLAMPSRSCGVTDTIADKELPAGRRQAAS